MAAVMTDTFPTLQLDLFKFISLMNKSEKLNLTYEQ